MQEINDAVDRIIAGMEGMPLVDSKAKRLIAYHEIGHAIVATLTPNHDPVEKVTLIPRGQAKGLTWFTPDEERGLVTRSQILGKIASTLGGRAAEDVIFGDTEVTTGASNDIEQLTSMARNMVTKFGMSELGPLALEKADQPVFLRNDSTPRSEYSEEIAARIDAQVRSIIVECYENAKGIIRDNRYAIDRIADILIEKETIEGEDFRKLVQEFTEIPETKAKISL